MDSPNPPTAPRPGDYIYQLACAFSAEAGDKGVLFAAGATGLFRSTDSGQSWQLAYRSLGIDTGLPTAAVVLAPDFKQEAHVFAGLNGAILASYDGGTSWQQSHLPSPPPMVSSLSISPHYAQDGMLFAGTGEDGVLVSRDRGRNWIAWNFGLLDLNVLCLAISPDFARDETLYAGTNSGLYRSANGGRAWREISLPTGYEPILSLALTPEFSRDNTLFLGMENQGLWVSQDRGKTWRASSETLAEQPVNGIVLSPNFSADKTMMILHGGELLISKDSGLTWNPWPRNTHPDQNVTAILAPHGFESDVFIGFEDGRICLA